VQFVVLFLVHAGEVWRDFKPSPVEFEIVLLVGLVVDVEGWVL